MNPDPTDSEALSVQESDPAATFDSLTAEHPSFDAVTAAFASYDDVTAAFASYDALRDEPAPS
jgi:hypothetical protein